MWSTFTARLNIKSKTFFALGGESFSALSAWGCRSGNISPETCLLYGTVQAELSLDVEAANDGESSATELMTS
jgi:hypothetical protein